MTNGDRIRQMSNEELAEFIRDCHKCNYYYTSDCSYSRCTEGIKAYLDMEVEEWINKKIWQQ